MVHLHRELQCAFLAYAALAIGEFLNLIPVLWHNRPNSIGLRCDKVRCTALLQSLVLSLYAFLHYGQVIGSSSHLARSKQAGIIKVVVKRFKDILRIDNRTACHSKQFYAIKKRIAILDRYPLRWDDIQVDTAILSHLARSIYPRISEQEFVNRPRSKELAQGKPVIRSAEDIQDRMLLHILPIPCQFKIVRHLAHILRDVVNHTHHRRARFVSPADALAVNVHDVRQAQSVGKLLLQCSKVLVALLYLFKIALYFRL